MASRPARPSAGSTVLTAWTGTLLRALGARGIDGAALAGEAGIAPQALADPDRRVPLAASTRLWRAAVEATRDPALGIEVSRFVRATTFHALGQAFLASPTLREALGRIARFSHVTADIALARAEPTADGGFALTITWRPGADPPAFEAVDAVLASIVRSARFMLDRSVAPVGMRVERPTPSSAAQQFTEFFGCPIDYAATDNTLVFDAATAGRPVPAGNPRLAQAGDAVLAAYLADRSQTTVTDSVRETVVRLLPSGDPTVEAVARAVHTSPRTLQRRLGEEGTNFRAVRDDARCELARAYLSAGDHSVLQLTYLLGFSEPAAFSRAFKRWTGVTPSAYR